MMKIQVGQTTIKLEIDNTAKTFLFNVITPMAGTWVEVTITKGVVSDSNMHIEVNIDNEIESVK